MEEAKEIRISRQTSAVQVFGKFRATGKCGIFQLFGSLIRNDARSTLEIKSSIAMAKKYIKKRNEIFTRKLDLNLRHKLKKWYFKNTSESILWIP